ncbi:MAG: hypothetical protein Q9209_006191 [Squamulea sp. 1 TL-2023]
MVSPHSNLKPTLHLNTGVGRPRLASVHFDAPLRPRASTRGSPIEPIDSPPFMSPPEHDSESSGSEAECWMRGRSPSATRVGTNLFGILASSATFNEMDLTGFRGHRDTLATLALRRIEHSTNLPIEVYARVLRYLDLQSYKSMRLTCRCWSAASTYIRPLRLPPVCTLPAEIIKHVYGYLSPLHMDAARHTCRMWMTASLEHRLLAQVMNWTGFRSAVEADAARNQQLSHPVGGEWRLSKRLATECSLSRGWTGNGFANKSTAATPSYPVLTHEPPSSRHIERDKTTSLFLSSTIDFTMVLQSTSPPSVPRFLVSSCGRFLLAVVASNVYVYRIREPEASNARYQHGGHMEFLICIACPGPILAISMDTSQGRYSIAALLEGRKGLIFDAPELNLMDRRSGSSSPHSERDTRNVTQAWDLKATPLATPTTSQRPWLPNHTDVYHLSPAAPSPSYVQSTSVPVQFVPHTLYRNLCSKTSPPLTVAIAPHRRCVAIGSSAGIELHWQDATTGQELSRWIELIGPAECIHFLLPLRSQDDGAQARSLRLVASRAGPASYHDPFTLNDAWGYEHCRFLQAIPLTDGRHLVFTDPSNGDLCIGTGLNRPFGGPKPVKTFILQRPEHTLGEKAEWPRLYKAGSELRWGARVVVTFGNDIWLYCIPPDWLSAPIEGALQGDVEVDRDGMVVIRGIKIGSLPDLDELAIGTSNGEVVIHAFSTTRPAQVWQIARHPARSVLERFVNADGKVLASGLEGTGITVRDFATQLDDDAANPTALPGHSGLDVKYTTYRSLDAHELPTRVVDDETHDIELKDFASAVSQPMEPETEDEGYASGLEDDDGEWGKGAEDEEVDMSLEDGWGDMRLVRLEVEVLCGG